MYTLIILTSSVGCERGEAVTCATNWARCRWRRQIFLLTSLNKTAKAVGIREYVTSWRRSHATFHRKESGRFFILFLLLTFPHICQITSDIKVIRGAPGRIKTSNEEERADEMI